ncbi:MAG: SCP-2 sterol transfer family protein [Deltaproteobacteria bacterium]|nr:SCP-2 sterol transfer family protein [Deltaproteobacteria bacterium]MCW5800993.1 SCP-2 sterol transfer family protein [Deltaproteobacteria bacterium]
MRHEFLSDPWFASVDALIAAAGDLQVPDAMKVDVNVTVTRPGGDVQLFMRDGLFTRGHQPSAIATVTVPAEIARKIFVSGDVAAGVQAFLAGEMKVEGDLAKVVAMQTIEPSAPQKALTVKIAEITA